MPETPAPSPGKNCPPPKTNQAELPQTPGGGGAPTTGSDAPPLTSRPQDPRERQKPDEPPRR